MTSDLPSDRDALEARFAEVFAHLDFICAYARRRGSRDPDGIGAEAMAIAWRRLADIPAADARPWLIVTVRNLLLAERRSEPKIGRQPFGDIGLAAPADELPLELDLDPDLAQGLRALPEKDREALLLIAWDDLTPALAAASLGISATAFRVRLHRARRRIRALLAGQAPVKPVAAREPSSVQPVTARQPDWTQA